MGEMGRGATGWGRWGGGQRGGLDGERDNGEGEMERGATGRGRWGGEMEMGEMGRGDGEGATKGETGKLAKGRGRRRGKRRGISHMKCLGGHMECLGGTRLQIFLTLFTPCNAGYPS